MKPIKIFVSSPGDVNEERAVCAKVIKRLSGEFIHRVRLEPVFWEHEPLRASATFQDGIIKPSQTDIVISILWTRLGTRLPSKFTFEGEGEAPTGTEFEVRDALQAYKEYGTPDLLVYKKTAKPIISDNKEEADKFFLQRDRLEKFTNEFFFNEDGSIKAAFHTFEKSSSFEDTLEIHLRKLIDRKAPPGLSGQENKPVWSGSPFRGLQRFELEHSPVYFGRSKAISDAMSQIKVLASEGRRFLLIQGMSGSGKSSLVCAGIQPLLIEPGVIEGFGLWRYTTMKAGDADTLFLSLASSLTMETALPELLSEYDLEELAVSLSQPGNIAVLMNRVLSAAALRCQEEETLKEIPKAGLVLVLDQLEEIFTRDHFSEIQRIRFFEVIKELADSGLVWVIGTLRSDFYSRCEEIPELMSLKEGQGQYHLQPPTASELGQMIRLPAVAAGISFEKKEGGSSLDGVILEQALKSPEALPLLEFCLEELYEVCMADGYLSFDKYEEIGRFEGALSRKADQTLAQLSQEAKESLPAVMKRLVTVDDESVVRRWHSSEDLEKIPGSKELISVFKQSRLIVTHGKKGESQLSLTHEALLRNWTELVQLIEKDRDFLVRRGRVEQSAGQWQAGSRDKSYLLPEGRALNDAVGLLEDRVADLDSNLVEYISISKSRSDKSRQQKKTIALTAIIILSLLTVISVIMSFRAVKSENVALEKQQEAERQREETATALDTLKKSNEAIKKVMNDQLEEFHVAVLQKSYKRVSSLLKETPALVSLPSNLGNKPLYYACKYGDLKMAVLLIENGAKISDVPFLLHLCALSGSVDLLNFIVGQQSNELEMSGAELGSVNLMKMRNLSSETVLHAAVKSGSLKMVDRVFQLGGKIEYSDRLGNTPLITACQFNNLDIVRYLVEAGAKLDVKARDGYSALMRSCQYSSNEHIVRYLLSKGADTSITSKSGRNVFMIAANHARETDKTNVNVVRLLRSTSDIDYTRADGSTALLYACYVKDFPTVKYLVEAGADVNKQKDSGSSPLIYACKAKSFEMVKYLVRSGAKLNLKRITGETALMYACQGSPEIANYLIDAGALVNVKKDTSGTPLMYACVFNSHKTVKKLLAAGADVNAKGLSGWTPLMYAARYGTVDLINSLLSGGADPKAENDSGYDAFRIAVTNSNEKNSKLEVVKRLRKFTNLDGVTSTKWSALMMACEKNDFPIVKYLVEQGASINLKDEENWTALMIACQYSGREKVIDFLLKQGADKGVVNDGGFKALLIAASYAKSINETNVETIKLLAAGNDVNYKDKRGWTPLMLSCQKNDLEAVKYLVSQGAELNSATNGSSQVPKNKLEVQVENLFKKLMSLENENFGWTALMLACKAGNLEIVKYLVEAGASTEVKDSGGNTALMITSKEESSENILEYLLSIGADSSVKDKAGRNAFLLAGLNLHDKEKSNCEKLKVLKKNCDIDFKDSFGITAVLFACQNHDLEALKYLVTEKASLEVKNIKGNTPLIIAVYFGSYPIVKYLLSQGVDISVKDKSGRTAIDYAESGKHQLIHQLLSESE